MNIFTKIKINTAEELLRKRFSLFNKEIIIPYKEFEKLDKDIVISMKIQGNCFNIEENNNKKILI